MMWIGSAAGVSAAGVSDAGVSAGAAEGAGVSVLLPQAQRANTITNVKRSANSFFIEIFLLCFLSNFCKFNN